MQTRPGTALAASLGIALGLAAGCAVAPADRDAPGATGEARAPIVGGTPTALYPAVPLLYSEFSQSDGAQLCSGTLISPHVILTAAHCVEFPDGAPSRYLAYFGADVTVETDPQRIGAVDIADYVFHPSWNGANLEAGNDIGLVVLAQAAPVAPMAYNHAPVEGLLGQEMHLVGWGKTSGSGEDVGVKREVLTVLEQASSLLLQYGSAAANTCQGDSGGPNFMSVGGTEVVAGITSFGNVGCDLDGFGTRVDAFAKSFIDPFVAEHDPGYAIPGAGAGQEGQGSDDDPGGADEGDSGDQDGSSEPVSGGCRAAGDGGRSGVGSGLGLAVAVLAAFGLRRRRH